MIFTLHVPLAEIEDGSCSEGGPFLGANVFPCGNGVERQ